MAGLFCWLDSGRDKQKRNFRCKLPNLILTKKWIEHTRYHTLAYYYRKRVLFPVVQRPRLRNLFFLPMTKEGVLAILAQNGGFLKPDEILARLYPRPNRQSFYTYLGRLRSQGLLERLPQARRGRLAYRITPRGRDRLVYLQGQIQR